MRAAVTRRDRNEGIEGVVERLLHEERRGLPYERFEHTWQHLGDTVRRVPLALVEHRVESVTGPDLRDQRCDRPRLDDPGRGSVPRPLDVLGFSEVALDRQRVGGNRVERLGQRLRIDAVAHVAVRCPLPGHE